MLFVTEYVEYLAVLASTNCGLYRPSLCSVAQTPRRPSNVLSQYQNSSSTRCR